MFFTGFVDLSKRRVNMRKMEESLCRYNRAKVVNSILRGTARKLSMKTNEELLDLYRKTAWYFSEKHGSDDAGYSAMITALS